MESRSRFTGRAILKRSAVLHRPVFVPVTSIYDRAPGTVTWSDGGFSIESIDSAGGWVGSAVDLVTFASSFVPFASHPLLVPATISEIIARPSYAAAESTAWYSKGWSYNAGNIFHDGTQPGQGSLLVRTSDGYVWAILTTRPATLTDDYFADIDRSLWSAIEGVTNWPANSIPFPVPSTQSDCIFDMPRKTTLIILPRHQFSRTTHPVTTIGTILTPRTILQRHQ